MIKFYEEGHKYVSVDSEDTTQWIGVTTLIKHFHEGFDAKEKAFQTSMRKPTKAYPNKWYGVPPSEIDAAWEAEKNRASELGHFYHGKREKELLDFEEIDLSVHPSKMEEGVKIAPEQVLADGIYPEHLVYLHSSGICGQADYVQVRNNIVYIRDYKTSKEIRRKGFTNYQGTKMMFPPIDHLEDCEFIHYAIQLSIYMYIILRHNPNYEPGEMIIEHIKFEKESEDKYGYPIYKKNEDGSFTVKEIEEIKVPYLKKEVNAILQWLSNNRDKIIKNQQ